MTKLFSPITFGNITLKNRIVMSPMCMYSVEKKDGILTSFHHTHYVSRAVGQVGLIMVEATAVLPEGRITDQDLGLWGDEHIDRLKHLNAEIHSYGAKTAIQLAHAGRKATVTPPIYAPSSIPFDETYETPEEMTNDDIQRTIDAFQQGAGRAKEANFDILEIHAAHGYLIHEFLSPLTNQRTDAYGGPRENRYRFLEKIIDAVQKEWEGPLFVRISTDEYHPKGNTLDDILFFANRMREQGVSLIDCSSGGIVPVSVPTYPGYQLQRCETIKRKIGIQTGAVGLITSGLQAEEILQNNRADLIFIGRALLRNPYWPKKAADELQHKLTAPIQYRRGWN